MALGGEEEETVEWGSMREEGPACTSLGKMRSESKEKNLTKIYF